MYKQCPVTLCQYLKVLIPEVITSEKGHVDIDPLLGNFGAVGRSSI
jgi:hypothetical protein